MYGKGGGGGRTGFVIELIDESRNLCILLWVSKASHFQISLLFYISRFWNADKINVLPIRFFMAVFPVSVQPVKSYLILWYARVKAAVIWVAKPMKILGFEWFREIVNWICCSNIAVWKEVILKTVRQLFQWYREEKQWISGCLLGRSW